jgi:PilZ domain-containing protein
MSNVLPSPLLERTACRPETHQERRRRERLRVCLPVYVRRLDQSEQEVATTVDITRHGLRFTTSRDHYSRGMSLLLTFPYSFGNLVRKEYLGEIVRVDDLNEGGRAVAVQFRP